MSRHAGIVSRNALLAFRTAGMASRHGLLESRREVVAFLKAGMASRQEWIDLELR